MSVRSETLVGRDEDLAGVSAHVLGDGAALVLGDPGAGKTALLSGIAAGAEAGGAQVRWASGVQFESDVSYSGLQKLLFGVLDSFEVLDSPHRDALRTALGFDPAAERSNAQGDTVGAIARLSRAAALTPEPAARTRRLALAAYLGARIGRRGRQRQPVPRGGRAYGRCPVARGHCVGRATDLRPAVVDVRDARLSAMGVEPAHDVGEHLGTLRLIVGFVVETFVDLDGEVRGACVLTYDGAGRRGHEPVRPAVQDEQR